MSGFRGLVLAALDAGDVAPDSAAGRFAIDRAQDVQRTIAPAEESAEYYLKAYGWRVPPPPCSQIAAVNLVLYALSETQRGVKVVSRFRG